MEKLSPPVSVSSSMVLLDGNEAIVGKSLTGRTFTVKALEPLACPSETVTVMTAVPLWLAAGRKVIVRSSPEPVTVMLALGSSCWLFELPVAVATRRRFPGH